MYVLLCGVCIDSTPKHKEMDTDRDRESENHNYQTVIVFGAAKLTNV